MAIYFVDGALGTDDGAHGGGIGANAWKTCSYAYTSASNGDTVNVANGLYVEVNYLNGNKSITWVGESKVATIIESTGTLRVVYVGLTASPTYSNFTFRENDTAATGSNSCLEYNSTGTATFTNCHFENGRYRGVWARTSGLILDNCTFGCNISTNYAAVYFAAPFTCVNSSVICDGTPSVHSSFSQSAAFSAPGTITIDGCEVTIGMDGQVLLATAGGGVTPVITASTFNMHTSQTLSTIECNNCINEAITGNTFISPSQNTGYNAIYLISTAGVGSVALADSNVCYHSNFTQNHVIMFGNETLTSVFNSYDGSTMSNNKIYGGCYLGLANGGLHGLMAAYNRVNIFNNEIHGMGLGIVLKHTGGASFASVITSGNKIYDCDAGIRIKGTPGANIFNNEIYGTKGEVDEVFSVTDNVGGDYSSGCKFYNNTVSINSGQVFLWDAGSLAGTISDYNNYELNGASIMSSGGYSTFALWQAAGYDTNSSLYNSSRQRKQGFIPGQKCIFSETFSSGLTTRENDGRSRKGALVFSDGVVLDGTEDYVSFNCSGLSVSKNLSIELEFKPDFAYSEDANRYLFSAGADYLVWKQNNAANNVLSITLGGTSIVDIASAVYGGLWNVGQKNKLIISSNGITTDVYLNGTKIVDADATAWSATIQSVFNVGADSSGANVFYGNFNKVKLYQKKFTAGEAASIYLDSTFDFSWGGLYPLTTATTDAGNSRTLDVSGNNKHLSYGAGAAAPTKLTSRGYQTDGNDYLLSSESLFDSTTNATLVCLFKNNGATSKSFANYAQPGQVTGLNIYTTSTQIRGYIGGAAGTNFATFTKNSVETKKIYAVILTTNGSSTEMWVNGFKATNAIAPLPVSLSSTARMSLFVRSNTTTSPCDSGDEIYFAACGNFYCEENQAQYLTERLVRELNLV